MSPRYAAQTTVPSSRSIAEISELLRNHGATQFLQGWDDDRGHAAIQFILTNRRIRFLLPMPNRRDEEFTLTPSKKLRRDPAEVDKVYEQAIRQRWRALLLIIKAKLEAVEAGIVTVEDEFLAHTVLPDGRTVGEATRPAIDEAYATGKTPALLPGMPA